MNTTLLRSGATLVLGCFLFISCSKSSQMAELSNESPAARNAAAGTRTAEGVLSLAPAPIAKDTMELMETNNPLDR